MRRTAFLSAAVAVPLLAVAGGTAAHAAPSASPAAGHAAVLTATPDGGSDIDAGPPGPSAGDQHLETGSLSDPAGHGAGRYSLVGELIALGNQGADEQLSLTLHLPDGDVVALGGIPAADNYTLPVIGGTGHFSGTRGTLSVHGSENRFTLSLRLER